MAVMESPGVEDLALHVVAPADGPETIPSIVLGVPDVVVVALRPGGVHPLQVCREVADRSPVTRVLIQAGPDEVAHSYQAIRIGAFGWIPDDASPADVHEAAEALARGEARLSPRHAAWVLRELEDATSEPSAGAPPAPDRPTASERTVLRLLAEGADPGAVADHLGVSPRVVGRHAGSAVARLHRRYRRPSLGTGEQSPALAR